MKFSFLKKAAKLLMVSMAFAGLWAFRPALASTPEQADAEARHYALRGVDMMMDGDLDGAVQVFQQIEQKYPDSPVGFLLEADAAWWKIYFYSGNLIDPDVFDVANMEATPFDSHFDDLNNVAIQKAEVRIRKHQNLARSELYEGSAFALRARLDGLHGDDFPTARAAKKMRSHLLKAMELDPNLYDADLGIGIYNYFVDTLPAIVKFLSVFIMLPGGSRSEGLQQLQTCAEKCEVTRAEAKFYLAKDFTRNSEKQYQVSVRLFKELQNEFPDNPLWPMLIGSIHFRMRDPSGGEKIYLEVLHSTAGKESEAEKAVHHAASQALERMHPDQKFP